MLSLKLKKIILLLIALPLVSLVFLSSWIVIYQQEKVKIAEELSDNLVGVSFSSDLIANLQVERGLSAYFLSSKRTDGKDRLDKQRQKVDGAASLFLGHLDVSVLPQELLSKVRENVEQRKAVRAKINEGLAVGEALKFYNGLISNLLLFQKEVALRAPSTLILPLQSIQLLEVARDSAGLLRAKLSSILKKDTPLPDKLFNDFIALRGKLNSNLASKALNVSEEQQLAIAGFKNLAHWQKYDQVYGNVLSKRFEGGYGADGGKFFSTMTIVVNDIGGLIGREISYLKQATENEISNASMMLLFNLLYICINILGVAVMSFLFSRHISKKFGAISADLSSISGQISECSSSMQETGTRLTECSNNLVTSVNETSASVHEIDATVSNNANAAKVMEEKCSDISGKAVNNSSRMEQASQAMGELKESTNQIERLRELISTIGSKTDLINNIVFQTKLLSFNASIEAERAGEHGRGFAVVASEISNLAQTSGHAAVDIASIVTESVAYADQTISGNLSKVDNCVELVREVEEKNKEMKEDTVSIKTNSSTIVTASTEQAEGVSQIRDAITSIENISNQNSENADSSAKASLELETQTQNLSGVIASLKGFVG